ncbi:DNA polymerase I [Legionella geestiana]|uniref:DNA polymerase I n=1 Tax=Legionella geestiana TaxID=45065 RepID=A0A0W0TNZ9_9GAMM|nr:DNA polymerase I [Legionella geestiana]KTC97258.1 DNA polymerase I [Legionella geestiana]QBS12390.1 DNA polymerase I [Legionella geestiana]QDQ39897.1 DNA polymerase I [Legionella geestiana]STX55171.1 DNA polymerase I [Legionella geestiana]
MTAPLVLVDGSSWLYRAFHALPPLTNSKGQATGAVYGVANMVRRLLRDYAPEHIAIVFDAKGKTFRDEWYPAYKANRPPMPQDLAQQIPILHDLLRAMGLPLLIIDGVEADDVIGTLARAACARGQRVIISTGDKDMAQLVSPNVTLVNTMNGETLDVNGVSAKFGVPPERIVDYLTLVGDTSDNVPGISGCGPKTAVKWLTQYGTLDNLLAHAADVGGKIGESLRAGMAHLPLSRRLVTIRDDVPLPSCPLTPAPEDKATLLEIVRACEFRSWIKELLADAPSEPAEATVHAEPQKEPQMQVEIITTWAALEAWIARIRAAGKMCVDTETTSLDSLRARIVGVALALKPHEGAYIPLMHTDGSPQLDLDRVLAALKPLLEDPEIQKIGQNLKYDWNVFKNHGITLQGITFDTMLESYVLNSQGARHDMDSLALKYLGHKTITYEEVAGKGAKQVGFDAVAVSTAAAYAAEDAEVTLRLHETLYPKMDARLKQVFHEIEMPLVRVLAGMERTGVQIDEGVLMEHGTRLRARIAALEEEACLLAGRPFNLSSPAQLQAILFGEQGLPVMAKTPGGQPSTAEAVLQELAFTYRLPAVILEYRSLSKLVSTYIEALPRAVNPETGRVHTSYNQAVAATGRLSSSEPNLQNIPVRTEEGRLIRRAFIAPQGHVLMSADYSQIELRIMAHLSEDPGLLRAFANDLDIHVATASEVFGVPFAEVSREQRRRAKAVNFGLIYGMSAFGLARQLGIERNEAQMYMTRYFERYPGVQAFMERTRALAHRLGYVETLFGRRLYLPEINAQNQMRKRAAERAAVNAPMQGTAADIIKRAMHALWCQLENQSEPVAKMIMQVHDELILEVPEAHVSTVREVLTGAMENAATLLVPLRVSVGVGKNWDEAH